MRSLPLVALCALTFAASGDARGAADAPIRVERVSGEPFAAQKLTSIAGGDVVLVADAGEVKMSLADVYKIPSPISLGVVLTILAIAVIASHLRRAPVPDPHGPARR